MRIHFLLPLLCLLLPATLHAEMGKIIPLDEDPTHVDIFVQPIVSQMHPQHGKVDIGNGLATLDMPENLGYLSAVETEILLHQLLRIHIRIKTLGSIVPTTVPIGSAASWFALITYKEDGQVQASGAQALDEKALLEQLQEQAKARNAKINKPNSVPRGTDILGWEENPHYDAEAHTLLWSLDVKPQAGEEQLKYFLRIFGRQGTLAVTTACKIEQEPTVTDNVKKIASIFRFNPPYRYEDFKPDKDRTASYNMADLILGKVNSSETAANRRASPAATNTLRGRYLFTALAIAAIALLLRFIRRRA